MHKVIFFLLFSLSLVADESLLDEIGSFQNLLQRPGIALIDFEGGPNVLVAGCVHALNGNFHESEVDLTTGGNNPLVVERCYCSANHRQGSLLHCWFHNHFALVANDFFMEECNSVIMQRGSLIPFRFERKKENYIPNPHGIDSEVLAYTNNCCSGPISGKTNLKNHLLKYHHSDGRSCKLTTGSGQNHSFKRGKGLRSLQLQHISQPNGTKIEYEYKDENHLYKAKAVTSKGKETGWLKFDAPKNVEEAKKNGSRSVFTSHDGRKVIYDFTHFSKSDFKQLLNGRFLLKSVKRPNAPTVVYKYADPTDFSLDLLIKKELPDNRFLHIEYYQPKKKYTIHDDHFTVKPGQSPANNVYCLKAPVGKDATPIITHTFQYNPKQGITAVYDAYMHLIEYHGEKDDRLKKIVKYKGTKPYEIACTQNFYWEGTQLIGTSIENGKGERVLHRSLKYDKKGNITQEELTGHLTGKGEAEEIITKRFWYSDEGLNLLKQSQEGDVNIFYGYKANTDLLAAKYIHHNNQVRTREFFEYDENGALITHIRDDGIQWNKESLAGVNLRLVERIENTSGYNAGLPQVIRELYIDPQTLVETLLKKSINHYDNWGKLIQQDTYDADEKLAYSIRKEYNNLGLIILETDPLGQTTLSDYDSNGNKVFEQGPNPTYYKKYTYDFSNRMTHEEECYQDRVLSKEYEYDYHNKVSSTDFSGNKTSYIYDEFGRITEIVFPKIIKEYDIFGNVTAVTDPNGHTTKTSYTVRGQPIRKEYPDGSVERWEYDLKGNLVKEMAKDGSYTSYCYDYLSRPTLVEIYDPSGLLLSSSSKEYNAFHLIAETDPAGLKTIYSYDLAGRLISTKQGEKETRYAYDSLGRVGQEKNYFGYGEEDYILCLKEYDNLDRVIKEPVQSPTGTLFTTVQYTYDADGNSTSTTRENQQGKSVTQTTYNAHKQPILILDPLNQRTEYSYEYFPTLTITKTDPLGNKTLTIHDAIGNVVEQRQLNSKGETIQQTLFTYDLAKNKINQKEIIHCKGYAEREVITNWVYDSMNQPLAQIEAASKKTSYTYANGKLTSITKPDLITLYYTYDFLDRLSTFYSSDNTFSYLYEYDKSGNITAVQDLIKVQTTKRSYDSQGQMIKEDLAHGLALEYAYDRLGCLRQVSYPDKSTLSYIYDGPNLKTVQRDLRYSLEYTSYDLSGNVLAITLPGTLGELHFTYDILNRPTTISSQFFTDRIEEFDPLGNITKRTLEDPLGVCSCTYSYDDLNQLTLENGIDSHDYLNDSLYNQVQKDGVHYSYNDLNQLLPFEYDLRGNLVQKEHWHYTYDALDRLIEAKSNQTTIAFTYDPFNRRLTKNDELYLYMGQNEVGSISPQGTTLRMLALTDLEKIGTTLTLETKGQTLVPIHDHLRNMSLLLDLESGKPIETNRYTAFGMESSQNPLTPWRYSDKRFDPETGLIYFGERYYDPTLCRFINPDPLGLQESPNLYAYVFNNPLKWMDPTGLFSLLAMPNFDESRLYNPTPSFSLPETSSYTFSQLAQDFKNSYENTRLGLTGLLDYKFNGGALNADFAQVDFLSQGLSLLSGKSSLQDLQQRYSPSVISRMFLKSQMTFGELPFFGTAMKPFSTNVTKTRSTHLQGSNGFSGRKGFELEHTKYQELRNSASTINGRLYSGHAIDQMQNRGIVPSVVENTIRVGIREPGKEMGTIFYYDPINNISVVTNPRGKIITTTFGKVKN